MALIVLAVAAIVWPAGPISSAMDAYQNAAFSNGFVNGYLTMDTLGAMVFGIVIVNAARSRGVTEARLLTRYTIWAGLMAGVGLTLLYLALFRLGSDSATLVDQSANGAAILHAYVQHTFGGAGSMLLAALIFPGLSGDGGGSDLRLRGVLRSVSAALLPHAGVYPRHLLHGGFKPRSEPPDPVSIPVLTAIYPPCIVLVVLSFTRPWWHNSTRIIAPAMFISLIFGILDGIKASAFAEILPAPDTASAAVRAGPRPRLMPSVVALVLAIIWDRAAGRQVTSNAH